MRILMTTDSIGGVWNYSLELCSALRPHGVQVALAVLGRAPSHAQRLEAARLANVTLYESSFRLEWMPDPWSDLARAADWLLAIEEASGADLVHLNHLVHADLPWHCPVITVGHSCVLSWWQATLREPAPAEWITYRVRVTSSLRSAACVVAPTEAALNELQRLYGPFARSEVIFNARNWRRFNAGHKERVIFAAGRLWDRAKNIEALATVASRVAAPIFVAGESDGPEKTSPMLAGVRLLGALDSESLANWYSRAAVYALPARYEPFGLTALEAAMSGCALVLGDIPSLREVWGAAARYVHPDDRNGLRDTLNELIANDSLRGRCAARAMARARAFSPARQAQQYRTLYQQVLGRESRVTVTCKSRV